VKLPASVNQAYRTSAAASGAVEPDMSEAAMEEDVLYGQLEGAIGKTAQICTPA
jgi:hypothetical protein